MFFSGTITIPQLINKIANELMASDPRFTNPEAASGYWTGDNTDLKYGNGAFYRRVIKWEDVSRTGQEKTLYIALECPWWDGNQSMFQLRGDYGQYMFGILITVSQTWDDANHRYPSEEANHQHDVMPIWLNNGGMSAINRDQLFTLNLAYWMWVDKEPAVAGNGFVVYVKPDPRPSGLGGVVTTSFLNLEKILSKEYSDGYSLWSIMSHVNHWPWGEGNQNALTHKWAWVLHPFSVIATEDSYGDANDYWSFGLGNWGNSMKGIDQPIGARLSAGGDPPKVYYMKLIIHAVAKFNERPLYQLEHFFQWQEGVGLIDQDVIAVESSTTKYLCLSKDCPDSTNRLIFALKYVQ